MELRFGPRSQVIIQLERRFPEATAAYLVGELVGHYYNELSPLDVIVQVPDDNLKNAREEAHIVSGYKLKNSDHTVFFHPMSSTLNSAVLADKFGLLYNLNSGTWLGRRVSDTTELADPDALLRYIRWRVYRVKDDDDPYPYRWSILPVAYERLNDKDRQRVLSTIRDIVDRMRLNARRIAGAYRDPAVWDAAGNLERMLQDDEMDDVIQDFVAANNIPIPVLKAFYNMYRYKDVHDTLEDTEGKIQKLRDVQKGVVLQLASTSATLPNKLLLGGKVYRKLSHAVPGRRLGDPNADV